MALWQFGRARSSQGKKSAQRPKSRPRRQLGTSVEPLEQRLLLSIAPSLVSIISDTPDEGDVITNSLVLHQAPQQLTFRFDSGQTIDASTLATGIQIVRSGNDGVFGNGNDVVVASGFIGLPVNSNEAVVRFLNSLPDDTYQITIVGAGAGALKNTQGQAFNNGVNSVTTFRLDLGAQVVSVVPQPITRNAQGQLQQATNQIVVYFNNDTLNTQSAQDTSLYQLIYTNQTATNNDDVIFNPTSVVYNPTTNSAVLTFAQTASLSTLMPLPASGVATYRLRVGDNSTASPDQEIDVSADAGSSFGTATPLGLLGNQTKVLTGGALDPPGSSPTNPDYDLVFPGSPTDPGQRDIPAQQHIFGDPNDPGAMPTLEYNFQSLIGTVNGNPVFNQITPAQEDRVREIFTMYGYYLGVKFVETASSGFTIATGDLRVVDPTVPTGPGGVAGIATIGGTTGEAVMDNAEDWGDSEFGGSYFQVAMHEIGHLLGLGHSFEEPATTIQGSNSALNVEPAEPVFPGDFDILGGQNLFPPDGSDIDLYSFTLNSSGTFTGETVAQRLANSSLADTVLTLFDSQGNILARNDDYFGSDSYLNLNLAAGTYYIAVTSTGNTNFNPNVVGSGFGGTTEGAYTLKLGFVSSTPGAQMVDTTGTALDGDADGVPGGDYNFWFNVADTAHSIFVDKSAPTAGENGTLAHPYNDLIPAIANSIPGTGSNGLGSVIRVVGNGGADGKVATLGDDLPYQVGLDIFNKPLSDGATLNLPKGVTLMVDAGAIFKLRAATINAGSFAQGIDLSASSIQVLGTPFQSAYFTSYNNEAIGLDTNPLATTPAAGDWSGFVFQDDSDLEGLGMFLNYMAFADVGFGGGSSIVDSVSQSFDSIDLITSRPMLYYNNIHDSAGAAISANPDSFQVSEYSDNSYTADYGRAGPEIHGNVLKNNSINGLFVRIRTQDGTPIDTLDDTAEFTATDIVYVLTENLMINGEPGGPVLQSDGTLQARMSASLVIDPGVVVKLQSSRIEVGMGAQLIAEGNAGAPIIFTSLADDTYGAGGVYDTTGDGATSKAAPGDWGGLDFDPVSKGSIDHAVIAYAGGVTPIEGGFALFNPVEIRQATVRLTNSTLVNNGSGGDNSDRNGRGSTVPATIFIRGAQPIIVDNLIFDNAGDAISINANAMTDSQVVDTGRSTGPADIFSQYDDNDGPMVRGNIVTQNDVNGMAIRGATLTRGTVWDDTDIVHVLRDDIDVPNFESIGGLKIESSPTASLVVKLLGATAGFTADGQPLDITDRIGGSVQILGTPGHPVVLTSLNDSTVGAGFDLNGNPELQTLGNGLPTATGASQLKIQFVPGPGIVNNSPALAVFQEAAAAWEAVLNAPVTVTIDIDMEALDPNVLGVTSSVENLLDYDDVRNHMIAAAGANAAFEQEIPTYAQLQATLPAGDTTVPFMAVTNANAKALGYAPSALTQQASAFDPTKMIDSTIEFNSTSDFDYDRTNGLTGQDFLATVIHEIGHALGFVSTVDAIDNGPTPQVPLTPFDVFRVAPGTGATNFTNTPRAMTPGEPAVFYDGGQFNDAALGLSPFEVGDIPLSTGANQGDGWQASHWKNRDLLGSSTPIGIMDPVVFPDGTITQADTRAMDLIGWNAVNRGAAGDWNGVTLTQYSNDTNMAVVNELEPALTGTTDTNNTTSTAQFLGSLAPNQQSGDSTNRLGFQVAGAISFDNPGDADIYSFNAVAGTQVWLDVDKTSTSLDSVVELIDGNGNILAQSDNSEADEDGTEQVFAAPGIQANSMNSSEFSIPDPYSTNTKDAGLRVVLPGTVGTTNTYYVRVRSSSSADLSNLTGGQTSGQYQLQVRLQETVEIPGSQISFADIRFATNGITVQGLPDASPLTSTSTEAVPITNTTLNTAQDLGNLLDSDQNILSVSSALVTAADVNWYKFELTYQQLESIEGATDSGLTWATVFDIDYADGLSRPDTTLSVFNSLGSLVYISRGSDVADDQTSAQNPSSQANLSQGSSGTLDPFLGTIQLPEGATETYYVAISSNASMPNVLINPVLPGAHLEPVDGVQRVVEDHIGTVGYNSNPVGTKANTILPTSPAILPIAPQTVANPNPGFPNTTTQQIGLNIAPFTLSDLQLFVSQNLVTPTLTQQRLVTVNPATGSTNAVVGNMSTGINGISDITIRDDGVMMAEQEQINTSSDAGQLTAIDPTTGQVFAVGQDKIPDYVPPVPPATAPRDQLTASQVGAIAYKDVSIQQATVSGDAVEQYQLYEAVQGDNGNGVDQSYLYLANPITGLATKDDANLYTVGPVGGSVRQGLNGGGLAGIYQTKPGDVGVTGGMAFDTSNGEQLDIPAASAISDAQTFSVTSPYKTVTFQFQHTTGGVPDGAPLGAGNIGIKFTGTETSAALAANIQAAINTALSTVHAEVSISVAANTPAGMTRIVVNEATAASNGTATGIAVSSIDGSQTLYGVSNTGMLYSINTNQNGWKLSTLDNNIVVGGSSTSGLATLVSDFSSLGVKFSGLTVGPQNLDLNGDGVGGDLATTLFAITTTGDVYAIDPVAGTIRMDVFKNAQGQPISHLSTGLAGVTGLAFSPLDFNLWHPTTQASAAAGHGVAAAPDNSRPTASGGDSYYFGFENNAGGYLSYPQNTAAGTIGPTVLTTQYGVDTLAQQVSLTRNNLAVAAAAPTALAYSTAFAGSTTLRNDELIGNNYNTPGGAHGDLITNSFSLAGYTTADMPTLYINYYADSTDSMSITVSFDNGATWKALPGGTIIPATTVGGTLTTSWNQYRGDLSEFAGQANIKIKFSFAAGVADNNHKGFMIDDIIVGFAARGEMVTGASPQTDYFTAPPATSFFPPNSYVPTSVTPTTPTQVLVGAYELTIRRGDEYGESIGSLGAIAIFSTMDINDRSIDGFTLQSPGVLALFSAPANELSDGQTFTIGNGLLNRTFEIDTGNGVGATNGIANTAIEIASGESAAGVGNSIVQAINKQSQTPIITANPGFSYVTGEVFTITDSTQTIVFEFTTGAPVPLNVVPVNFSQGESADGIADDIQSAINGSKLNVFAVNAPGSPQVIVNNALSINVGTSPLILSTAALTLSATFDPSLDRIYITGAAITGPNKPNFSKTPALDYVQETLDGDTFSISDGVNSRTFEYDDNGVVSPGDIAVPFTMTDNPVTLAAKMATAINSQFGQNFKVSATSSATSARVNLFGAAFVDDTDSSVLTDVFEAVGDQNVWRPQGEVILQNNQITSSAQWGIQVLPGTRDATGAHPGAAAVLASVNSQRLVPGLVIQNNIVDSSGVGGILYSGDPNGTGLPNGVVPFGRIVNNTIYGAGVGIGISVTNNASPTLMNNIVANLATGISVDATSASTIIGGTLYQGNTANVSGTTLGSFPAPQPSGAPLFVDAANHNFNLLASNASGLANLAIDSAISSLQDRQAMITIDSPIGIPVSPILAPTTDLTGKNRIDDTAVNPPFSGLGLSAIIDRGALDLSDFAGPTAALRNPVDNNASDQDPAPNSVLLAGQSLANFQIQLSDGTGSGVDPSTVSAATFTLTKNGVPLVLGVDYTFGYDATNGIAQFTPLVGIWPSNAVYVITVDNSLATGVKDLAGNRLLPTPADPTGLTKFTIALEQLDYGDAPAPYPTLLADNGARAILSDGLWLGATVTPDADGQPSANANADSGDDGVVFNTPIMPGTTASITVTATQAGKLDAWIDWQGDGTWTDAGDQIFTSQQLVAGANVLTFAVPATVTTTTFARFRVSTAGGLAPTGLSADGEVEDYQVTITPPVAYTTKLFNATTGVELLKDSTGEYVALAGTTIQAQVYVEDLRNVGAAGGIFTAFADLTRDTSGINWGSLVISSNFPNDQSGTIDGVNQVVDEAGGLAGLTPTGAGTPELLFSVNGTISQSLTPGTVVNITPDPADDVVLHPTTVFGEPGNVSASYTGAKFIIPIHPWQNPSNNLDVDASGQVVPLDALKIINELNLGLGGPLPQSPVPPNIPPPYYDVNGDGNLTPLDALLVIAFLNSQSSDMAGGAPPATPAAATAGGAGPVVLASVATPVSVPTVSAAAGLPPDSTPLQSPLIALGASSPVTTSSIASVSFVNAVATSDLAPQAAFMAAGAPPQIVSAGVSSVAPAAPAVATTVSASTLSASSLADDQNLASLTGSTSQIETIGSTILSVAQAAVSRGDATRIGRPQIAPDASTGADRNSLQQRVLAQLFGGADDDSDSLELADIGPRLENAWNQAKGKWGKG